MTPLEELKARYAQYEKELTAAHQAHPFGGYLGFGTDARRDPCNMRFYEDVQAWTAELAAACPDPDTAAQVVEWLLFAPEGRQKELAFPFLVATQGHARMLIGALSDADRAAFAARYDKAFPKYQRLPVQKEILKMLRA